MSLTLTRGLSASTSGAVTVTAVPEGAEFSHLFRGTAVLCPPEGGTLRLSLPPRAGALLLFPAAAPAWLCGPLSCAHTLTAEEPVFAVALHPGCGDWLWSDSMTALENRLTLLEPLLNGSDRLCLALHSCVTPQEQTALIARLSLLHGARQYQCAPLLRRCLDLMQERRGQIRVSELAQELGCSERYLNRLLRQKVGLSTKTVCEILQLMQTLELIAATRPKSLLHAAVACGYFDQAHMNRHFRSFLGCSASALRQREDRLTPLL